MGLGLGVLGGTAIGTLGLETTSHLGGLGGLEGVRLMIGGDDLSPDYAQGSLSIGEDLEARETASATLHDAQNLRDVEPGAAVNIYVRGVHVFGGSVESVNDEWPAMDEATPLHISDVSCVGNTAVADRRRVAASYAAGQTPGAIVADLLTNFLAAEGVTTGLVEGGSFELGAVNFSYETVATALGELAELVGFVWYIDEEKRLNFHSRDSRASPFGYASGSFPVLSLTSQKTRETYRNRMYLRAGHDISESSITRKMEGDGERTTFSFALAIGSAPAVRVDRGAGFVAETVGINGTETGKNWYYQKGGQDLEQDDGGTVLSSTDVIEVTYNPLLPIIVQADDEDEIAARQTLEGGSGLYEGLETDERIEDEELAIQRANGLLLRLASISRRLSIEVDRPGLVVGQCQAIEHSRESLSGDYLIVSATITDRGDGDCRIAYEAVDGDNVGGWPEFFRKLARAGVSFAIRENEILIVIREKKETVTFADAVTATTGDNLTAWTSDPYTVGRVGVSEVGGDWTLPDGTKNAYGPRVGEVASP